MTNIAKIADEIQSHKREGLILWQSGETDTKFYTRSYFYMTRPIVACRFVMAALEVVSEATGAPLQAIVENLLKVVTSQKHPQAIFAKVNPKANDGGVGNDDTGRADTTAQDDRGGATS